MTHEKTASEAWKDLCISCCNAPLAKNNIFECIDCEQITERKSRERKLQEGQPEAKLRALFEKAQTLLYVMDGYDSFKFDVDDLVKEAKEQGLL